MKAFFQTFRGQSWFIVIATTIIYGLCLNNLNLWGDEIYSVLMAKDSFTEMWQLLTTEDSKPPLYYVYLKGILLLFPKHYEIWAAHFASFLLLIVAQLFSLTVMRRDYGDRVALWMAIILALMPCSLWLALEVRTYMLSALLLFMALIYGLRLLDKPSNADFIKFGIITILALYSHYYCTIWMLCLYAGIFVCMIHNRQFTNYGKKFLFIAVGVAILFAPWLLILFHTAGEISQSWYVDWEFVRYSPLFFFNPFDPEILQSNFFMATQFITVSFSFIVLSGILGMTDAPCKVKRLYWFALGTFFCSYLLLIGLSFAIRPLVTARYLKIFALVWYTAGVVVLTQIKIFKKTFAILAVLLFGFSYVDIRTVAFDTKYQDAVREIRQFIPRTEKLITLDNANLFCEYYLPEYTCLSIVGETGEILRKPSILKNISYYSQEAPETSFVLSIYSIMADYTDCITYNSIYRRGQELKLCKLPKQTTEKKLKDSLNLRLKKY
ncbi:MAG: glycosyltransferase family 39 protein [Acetobacter sp.]|nr:glycosyltransferase family 39 protein [Acetobacter sp.]